MSTFEQKNRYGACYDVNAVAERWVVEDVLNIIERQFDVRIAVSEAKGLKAIPKGWP